MSTVSISHVLPRDNSARQFRLKLANARRSKLLGGLSLTSFLAACGGGGGDGDDSGSVVDPAAFVLNTGTGVYENGSGDGTLDMGSETGTVAVDGGAGNDTITTGSGADAIRAGSGDDTVDAGAGNDEVLMIGITGGSDYTQTALNAALPSAPSRAVINASLVNGNTVSDASAGDSINGGADSDTLYTLGRIDLSDVTITDVEALSADGDVTLDISQLSSNGGSLASLQLNLMGGNGVLRLTNDSGAPTRVDISVLSSLTGVQQIDLGDNVILEIEDASELASASVVRLTGSGTIDVTGTTVGGSDLASYAIADGVSVLAGGDLDANKLGGSTDTAAPTFSGSTTATVAENTIDAAVTGLGSFSDNIAVTTYTLLGDDAAFFNIDTSTGVLTLTSFLDFDASGDANADGVYDITIRAADAIGNTTDQHINLTLTDLAGDTGNVTEGDWDTMETSGTLSVVGATTITPNTYSSSYGSLSILANGSWTYAMDSSGAQTAKALDGGESVADVFSVATEKGNVDIIITINGIEDAAEFSSGHTATLTEQNKHSATLTATGTVVIDDPDTSDTATVTVTAASGLAGMFGSLDIDGSGAWIYTLNHDATQILRTGESVTDRVYVSLSDGSTEAIVVTINGADEVIDDTYYTNGKQPHFDANQTSTYPTVGNGDVWQRYTGIGVKVGVADDGLDSSHDDIAANYDASLEVSGTDVDNRSSNNSEHGTAVGGIIAAQGQNGFGVVGIAFNASLTGLPYLASGVSSSLRTNMEAAFQNFDRGCPR